MPFTPVEEIVDPTYTSMQFDGTVNGIAEMVYAIESGMLGAIVLKTTIEGFKEPNNPNTEWRFSLMLPGMIDVVWCYASNWVVVSSAGKIEVYDDGSYRAKFIVPEGV